MSLPSTRSVALFFAFAAVGAFLSLFTFAASLERPQMAEADELSPLIEYSIPPRPEEPVAADKRASLSQVRSIERLLAIAGDPPLEANETWVRVPILMYHRIRPIARARTSKERYYTVTPEAFARQMEELTAAGYVTLTPEQLTLAIQGRFDLLPAKPVLLTFDDGYVEHYSTVFPIMRRLGLRATFYIPTSFIGKPGNMTGEMLREMDQSGLATFGSHTRHHVFLARLGRTTQQTEIVESKNDLEQLLGHAVSTFAYSFGSWNLPVAREVQAAGYTNAMGVRLGSRHQPSSLYALRRILILNNESVVPILDAFMTNRVKEGN